MKAHIAHLIYLIRHKWFVFLECCKLDIWWLGIVHDWSKFLPFEWRTYVGAFYNPDGSSRDSRDDPSYYDPGELGEKFDHAWLHHIHWNKHHWQHWLLVQDEDEDKVLAMPAKYLLEMVADWRGAGRAQGKPDTLAWFCKHWRKIKLHPDTDKWVWWLLHGG